MWLVYMWLANRAYHSRQDSRHYIVLQKKLDQSGLTSLLDILHTARVDLNVPSLEKKSEVMYKTFSLSF